MERKPWEKLILIYCGAFGTLPVFLKYSVNMRLHRSYIRELVRDLRICLDQLILTLRGVPKTTETCSRLWARTRRSQIRISSAEIREEMALICWIQAQGICIYNPSLLATILLRVTHQWCEHISFLHVSTLARGYLDIWGSLVQSWLFFPTKIECKSVRVLQAQQRRRGM